MSGVNKLQLVDGNKLSAVLELIKKDIEAKQILAMLEKTDNFILEEKKNAMEKKNDRQGENIVEFIKNKNSLKRKFEDNKKEEKEDGKKTISGRLEDVFTNRLEGFFKKNNLKEKNGKIKIGKTSVNKQDLLYDLSHMAEKPSSFNLRSETHKSVLKELKKMGMPAGYIRNRKLREIYKKEESESESDSLSESDSGGMRLFSSPSTTRWFGDTRGKRRGRKQDI